MSPQRERLEQLHRDIVDTDENFGASSDMDLIMDILEELNDKIYDVKDHTHMIS